MTVTTQLVEVIRSDSGAAISYADIYRRNASVRTVVDMLSLHFAQVGLKTYERVSDLDRRERSDSRTATVIGEPNVDTPPARFFRETAVDYFIFGNAYWTIITEGGKLQLLRLPPDRVILRGGGLGLAREYLFTPYGAAQPVTIPKEDVVHFKDDPDPRDPRLGLSRLTALNSDLVEAAAASEHMLNFWKNAAQNAGVIERPLAAPEWSDEARARFEKSWANRYAGADNAGKTGVLEEGMTLKDTGVSPAAAQLIEARTFTLESVARAYGVPIAVLGLGENATYASQKQFHEALYQDTLGPHFRVFEDEINLQLLPRLGDGDLYVEFNIAEKLQGAFEEQVGALQSAIGTPWMTPDEGRARLNLPQKGGAADELIAAPGATTLAIAATPPAPEPAPVEAPPAPTEARSTEQKAAPGSVIRRRRAQTAAYEKTLAAFFERQAASVQSKLGAKASVDDAFDSERWDRELALVLQTENGAIARGAGSRTAAQLKGRFDARKIAHYIRDNAEREARLINATTKDALGKEGADAVAVFGIAKTSRAEGAAISAVTRYNAFGRHEAAEQSGKKTKTWIVSSDKSRHPELDGERVPLSKPFSNGGMWPGDPDLPTEETAHCECLLDF